MENQEQLHQEIGELEKQLQLKKEMQKIQRHADKTSIFTGISPKLALIIGILSGVAIVSIIGFTVLASRVFSDSSNARTNAAIIQPPNVRVPDQQLGNQPNVPVNVSVDDDAFLGKKDAPITIIEFSDFQCPFCRTLWRESLPQIKKEYIDTGKVKFVYRDFPLSFHQGAKPAAEGAECAREQGKFWEMHDKIFEEQEKQGQGTIQFTAQDVKTWASQIGLNASKFNKCLDSGKYNQEVEKDIADGSAAGVNGTPATFINGRLISGAQPFAAFKIIIDEELKKLDK